MTGSDDPRYSTCFICNESLDHSKVRPPIAWLDDPEVDGHTNIWAVFAHPDCVRRVAHPALDLDALELNASVATGVLVRLRALVQGLRQRVIAPRYSTRYVCTSACFICNDVLYWNSRVRPAIAWVDDPAVAGHLWAVCAHHDCAGRVAHPAYDLDASAATGLLA